MIVSIGGGELSEGQTSRIDTFVLQASGRTSPKVLFLPTASRDAPGYITTIEGYFGIRGCEVRALSLTANPSLRTITEAFGWAEVIYVGGGDTVFLVKTWNRLGLKTLCSSALERGVVLAGISAGAICWFEGGRGAYNGYKPLLGLGLVPGTVVPHYRPQEEKALSPVGTGAVFGISDRAALVWDGVEFGALAETDEAGVWLMSERGPERVPGYAEAPRRENAADTL